MLLRAATAASALVLLCGWFAASAHADGDPASDVLATQSLFLPQDGHVAAAQQTQLEALLEEAGRDGAPIRVALVASPADLGSVTALWRRPQDYARFLGQELSLVYRGLLLVVMPDGYGLFRPGGASSGEQSALARATVPGSRLGSHTIVAVGQLAASSGHPLPLPSASSASGGGSSDPVAWVVFALGGALIAVAWTASVRARPVGG